MRIDTVVSAPFDENSYIAWLHENGSAVVIDPGFEPEAILTFLMHHHLTAEAILNTHGHVDHIAGNAAMKEAFPQAPLIIGVGDAEMLGDPTANMSIQFDMPITSPPPDRTVAEGDELEFLGANWLVREVPGHSPGHVAFVLREEQPPIVFGGDILFQGSIGRTDFPGGSHDQLISGIRKKLFTLPDETVVYPGHQHKTTIGVEKRSNPFLG